jgi:hypothetical protein
MTSVRPKINPPNTNSDEVIKRFRKKLLMSDSIGGFCKVQNSTPVVQTNLIEEFILQELHHQHEEVLEVIENLRDTRPDTYDVGSEFSTPRHYRTTGYNRALDDLKARISEKKHKSIVIEKPPFSGEGCAKPQEVDLPPTPKKTNCCLLCFRESGVSSWCGDRNCTCHKSEVSQKKECEYRKDCLWCNAMPYNSHDHNDCERSDPLPQDSAENVDFIARIIEEFREKFDFPLDEYNIAVHKSSLETFLKEKLREAKNLHMLEKDCSDSDPQPAPKSNYRKVLEAMDTPLDSELELLGALCEEMIYKGRDQERKRIEGIIEKARKDTNIRNIFDEIESQNPRLSEEGVYNHGKRIEYENKLYNETLEHLLQAIRNGA